MQFLQKYWAFRQIGGRMRSFINLIKIVIKPSFANFVLREEQAGWRRTFTSPVTTRQWGRDQHQTADITLGHFIVDYRQSAGAILTKFFHGNINIR